MVSTALPLGSQVPMPVLGVDGDGVRSIRFPILAHSLFRSVEYNVVRDLRVWFRPPVLDLGCGDGSFTALLLDHIALGIDLRPDLASHMSRRLAYASLAVCDAGCCIPVADGSFQTVFSNSVIEHVPDLDRLLAEVARVLAGGGRFIFTVPTDNFTRYLATCYGDHDARQVNSQLGHLHLLTLPEWCIRLNHNGLQVIETRQYLSYEAVVLYRILASRLARRAECYIGRIYRVLLEPVVYQAITDSVKLVAEGAGLAVVAIKDAGKREH